MNKISFETMPQVLAQLEEKVDALTEAVSNLSEKLGKVQSTPEQEKMVTVTEAAKIVKLSVSRVRTLVQEGVIPCYKPGRNLLFLPSELYSWMSESRKTGQPSIEEQMEKLSRGMRNRSIWNSAPTRRR